MVGPTYDVYQVKEQTAQKTNTIHSLPHREAALVSVRSSNAVVLLL